MVNDVLPKLIREVAKKAKLGDDHIIDVFEALGGKKLDKYSLFCRKVPKDETSLCDFIHPNEDGYRLLAQTVYDHLIKTLFE